jgi:hypothetical protein
MTIFPMTNEQKLIQGPFTGQPFWPPAIDQWSFGQWTLVIPRSGYA